MKMKYLAILALAVWLGVAGWLASMVISKPAVMRSNQGAEDSAMMAEVRLSLERNKQMRDAIDRFSAGADSYLGSGPLIAVVPAVQPAAAADVPAPTPTVSLVLSSAGRHTAFVNGEQVRAGQRLSSGGTVRAIGADWVSIDDPVNGRQTYRVPSILSSKEGTAK